MVTLSPSSTSSSKPTLSALICNYNHGAYVEQAIESVLGQTRAPDELIVVDDGSTDNSVQVLQELARRHPAIRLIAYPQNVGLHRVVLLGLEQVRGDYVMTPCADDVLLPTFFESMMGLLERFPEVSFGVGCIKEWFPDRLELPSHQQVTMAAFPGPCYVSPETLYRMERAYLPSGLLGYGSVFKTDVLRRILPDLPQTGHLLDWFFLRAVAFREGFCFLPEVVLHRRNLPGSISDKGRPWPARRRAVLAVLELLESPEYADVRGQFRDTGCLVVGGYQAVAMMCANPRFWGLVTPLLLAKGTAHLILTLMPGGLRNWVRYLQSRWVARRRP